MSFTLRLELQSANISRSNWRSNTEEAVGVIQRSVFRKRIQRAEVAIQKITPAPSFGIFRCAG